MQHTQPISVRVTSEWNVRVDRRLCFFFAGRDHLLESSEKREPAFGEMEQSVLMHARLAPIPGEGFPDSKTKA